MILFFSLFYVIVLNLWSQTDDKLLLNAAVMQSSDAWLIVNDGVMGGLSNSAFELNKAENIVFSGTISLKNNGGFVSLRSPIKNYNLKNYSGFVISIKGDGKKCSISMKETSYFTGLFYTSNFRTEKNKWITIKIPFENFSLYSYGKEKDSNPNIPLDNIKEISFLLGDKQEGSFKVEIEYIKLY